MRKLSVAGDGPGLVLRGLDFTPVRGSYREPVCNLLSDRGLESCDSDSFLFRSDSELQDRY